MAFRTPLIVDGPNAIMRVAGAVLGKRLDEPTEPEVERVVATTLDRLERAREAAGSERIIVAFDAPTSWRKVKYPPYKANRPPERTARWAERLRRAIAARFDCYHAADHEADDVIATLVQRAREHGHRVDVLSSDSDLLVLAGMSSVYQYGTKGEAPFVARSAEWVCAKYGLRELGLLAEYKALVGEQGEGLPGIAGIGPVKARKLLHDHGTLERLIFRLLVPEADARLMLDLVTLRTDAPVEEWPGGESGLTPATASGGDAVIDHSVQTLQGETIALSKYRGSVMLVVNTASECGFTPQYEGLEKLYETYAARGLVVVGFPSNDFGAQEPGTAEEIATFCRKNYGVTFPMMAKVHARGAEIAPVYKTLTTETADSIRGDVKWNFTKFLVDTSGKVVARFEPTVDPLAPELTAAVEKLLPR